MENRSSRNNLLRQFHRRKCLQCDALPRDVRDDLSIAFDGDDLSAPALQDELAFLIKRGVGFAVAVAIDRISFAASGGATDVEAAMHRAEHRFKSIGGEMKTRPDFLGRRLIGISRIHESLIYAIG